MGDSGRDIRARSLKPLDRKASTPVFGLSPAPIPRLA